MNYILNIDTPYINAYTFPPKGMHEGVYSRSVGNYEKITQMSNSKMDELDYIPTEYYILHSRIPHSSENE